MRLLMIGHTGGRSGAEEAALRLLKLLPPDVEPVVACPDGLLADAVRELGVERVRLPEASVSLSVEPAYVLRAATKLAGSALALRRAIRHVRPDVMHATSIRAGLLTALADPRARTPTVVVIQDCLPCTSGARIAARQVDRRATTVIANSRHTAERWRACVPSSRVEVLYLPGDVERFANCQIDRADARELLGLPLRPPVLGIVGQITPWKGQADAISALAHVRRTLGETQLAIAGTVAFKSKRYDNDAYIQSLRLLSDRLGVRESVHWLGHRADVETVYRAIDLLLVPSWEEPFGLVVVEAMASGTPVLATEVGGPAEIITEGIDGYLLPPRRPREWANRATQLLSDRTRYAAFADAARRDAARFDSGAHVAGMLDVYERAVHSHDWRVPGEAAPYRVRSEAGSSA